MFRQRKNKSRLKFLKKYLKVEEEGQKGQIAHKIRRNANPIKQQESKSKDYENIKYI